MYSTVSSHTVIPHEFEARVEIPEALLILTSIKYMLFGALYIQKVHPSQINVDLESKPQPHTHTHIGYNNPTASRVISTNG